MQVFIKQTVRCPDFSYYRYIYIWSAIQPVIDTDLYLGDKHENYAIDLDNFITVTAFAPFLFVAKYPTTLRLLEFTESLLRLFS